MKLREFLNQPKQYHDKNMWIMGLVYGLIVYLILVILQPFGINTLGNKRFFIELPFAIVTFASCILPYYILPVIKRDFFQIDKWTIGRNMALTAMIVTFVVIGNSVILYFIYASASLLSTLWTAVWQTITISVLAISIGLVIPDRGEKRKEKIDDTPLTLTITGTAKNEQIDLALNQLLYVESDRNYCKIATTEGIRQIRATMTSVEEQLAHFPQIRKCHRAYLVNLSAVISVNGNSTAGYRLIMSHGVTDVPVSRTYAKDLIASLA